MPAQLPTIEDLDANGREEWEAEQTYLTESNGHKIDFSEMEETPARVRNLIHFKRRESQQ